MFFSSTYILVWHEQMIGVSEKTEHFTTRNYIGRRREKMCFTISGTAHHSEQFCIELWNLEKCTYNLTIFFEWGECTTVLKIWPHLSKMKNICDCEFCIFTLYLLILEKRALQCGLAIIFAPSLLFVFHKWEMDYYLIVIFYSSSFCTLGYKS